VTNRHLGAEVVERYVLSSRAGSEPGTTELSVRPVDSAPAKGLPLPSQPTRVVLNAEGEPLSGDEGLAQALGLALGARAGPEKRVALPGGGWFLLKTRAAPTLREVVKGRTLEVLRLNQRLEGKLSTGDALSGELRYSIRRDLDGELVGLRGVQRLYVEGQVLETVIELDRSLFSAGPVAPTPADRRVGLAPKFGRAPSLAAVPALGWLVFVFLGLGARRLGKRRSICLLLCGAMLFMSFPCAQRAEAGWPFGLDEKLKEVAEKVAPVVTAIGFGIAGGVVGSFVGGPFGALVGATSAAAIGYTVYGHYFAKKEVADKRHEPASRYVSGLGGVGVVEDDEDWVLVLRDGEETLERYVSKEVFDRVEVGESFRLSGGDAFDDDVVRDATASERRALREAEQRGEPTVTLPGTSDARGAADVLDGLSD
jgi:hypothetical protein